MEKPISSPSGMGGLIQCANGSTNIGSTVLQAVNPNNGHAGNNSVSIELDIHLFITALLIYQYIYI